MYVSKRIAPRDEWPDLRFTLRPFPWTWKVKPWLYHDDVDGWRGHWQFQWFCLTVEWWANVPMFLAAPFRFRMTGSRRTAIAKGAAKSAEKLASKEQPQ